MTVTAPKRYPLAPAAEPGVARVHAPKAGGPGRLGAAPASRGRAPSSALDSLAPDWLTPRPSPSRVHFRPQAGDARDAVRVDAAGRCQTPDAEARAADHDRFRYRP